MPTRPPTTNTRHRSAALALAALAALAGLGTVAGCASDPPPTPAASIVLPTNPTSEPTPSDATPPVSATEPPTATRSSTPASGLSPIPPAARQRTARGAEAFVRYYIAEYNRAMVTPATGLLPQLSTPDCAICRELEDSIHALVKDQERYAHASVTITHLHADSATSAGERFVIANLTSTAVDILDRGGVPVQHVPSAPLLWEIKLRWTKDHWVVQRIRGVL